MERLIAEGSDAFEPVAADAALNVGAVYRHGNVAALQRMIGIRPAQGLYVGDNLGQDGAAPKRAGLYTVVVVPELGEDRRWVQEHHALLARRAHIVEQLEALERGRDAHGRRRPSPRRPKLAGTR